MPLIQDGELRHRFDIRYTSTDRENYTVVVICDNNDREEAVRRAHAKVEIIRILDCQYKGVANGNDIAEHSS